MRIATLLFFCLLMSSVSAHAGVFAEVGIHVRSSLDRLPNDVVYIENVKVNYPVYYKYDVNYTRNPYGSLAFGYQWHYRKDILVSFTLRHESSLETDKDKGINEAGVTIRWGQ